MTDLKGADKASFVRAMFARISARYDLINRLMTFGLDQGWRRRVVAEAAVPAAGWALDLATGTGDIALAFPAAAGVNVVGGRPAGGPWPSWAAMPWPCLLPTAGSLP
jgi:ubiquinone/menaquinone biosynthesis C-methylase UbiE